MIQSLRIRRAGLVAVNLALGAGLWFMATHEPEPVATRAPPRPLADAPLPSAVTPAALPSGRSFFRSPVPDPGRTAALPAAPLPKLRLVGVLILEGRQVGLIEIEGAGTRRVSEGDEVLGWRVEAIRAREVSLRQGERQAAYALDALSPRR